MRRGEQGPAAAGHVVCFWIRDCTSDGAALDELVGTYRTLYRDESEPLIETVSRRQRDACRSFTRSGDQMRRRQQ